MRAINVLVMGHAYLAACVAGMPGLNGNLFTPSNDIQKAWNSPGAASEQEWQKALCKGRNLFIGMKGSDAEAGAIYTPPRTSAQTEFTNFPQNLADWDYYWNPLDTYARQMDNAWGIGNALRSLGVSDKADSDGGHIEAESVTHGNPYAEDEEGPIPIDEQQYPEPGTGRQLPVTMAHFSLGINPTDGILIVFEKRVARFQGQTLNIPTNNHDAYGSNEYNNLRYYMVASVMNDASRKVIQRVLETTGTLLTAWPGQEYTMDQDEGLALLGTPVGFPIGYMLQEHKRELEGNMYVSKVRLFKSSTSSEQACFLFYIEKPRPSAESVHGFSKRREAMVPKL